MVRNLAVEYFGESPSRSVQTAPDTLLGKAVLVPFAQRVQRKSAASAAVRPRPYHSPPHPLLNTHN